MSIQKTELKRVIKFAESLGLKVFFRDANEDYHGCYMHPEKFEPGVIEVCRNKRTPITFQIITLLHEIGHHLDFIESGKMPDSYNHIDSDDCPDWARKSIFKAEHRACKHAEKLYWTLRLRVPFWKVKMELSSDVYLYRVFKNTGDYPTTKQFEIFKKTWKKKFKEKYSKATPPSRGRLMD